MNPDSSKYESLLAGWLDGTLSAEELEQFEGILLDHPDLISEAETLSFTRLVPEKRDFQGKRNLKRTPAELSPSQVEYLSVAHLENEITPDQEAELMEALDADANNKHIFDSINRTKLIPPDIKYLRKSSLRRLTLLQKSLRIAAVSLSAAATVAIILISSFLIRNRQENVVSEVPVVSKENDSLKKINTIKQEQPPEIIREINYSRIETKNRQINIKPEKTILAEAQSPEKPSDEIVRTQDKPEIQSPMPLPVRFMVTGIVPETKHRLIAFRQVSLPSEYENERSRVVKFIASAFREKILKEERPTDDRLRAYEIAQAGVSGLNRLLDWQMKLVETQDTAGSVKSVYFSSSLLTFNAPVKKSDAAE